MSQQGFYGEDELRTMINGWFDLRIDREAFQKPSRDLTVEIYSKFIEYLLPKWHSKPSEAPLEARLTNRLKKIFAPFNVNYTFHAGDLLMPTKKRLLTFLNVLVYVKALIDSKRFSWQQMEEQWQAESEEYDHMKAELDRAKVELEEAAFKVASLEPEEDIIARVAEKRRIFEVLERESETLSAEKNKIKESIKGYKTNLELKKIEREQIKETKQIEIKVYSLIKEVSELEQKISDLKLETSNAEKDLAIALSQEKSKLVEAQTKTEEFRKKSKELRQSLKLKLEECCNEYKRIVKEREHDDAQYLECIDKAKIGLASMFKRDERLERLTQEATSKLINSRARQETLLGKNKVRNKKIDCTFTLKKGSD